MTYEEFKKALPRSKRKLLTPETFEYITKLSDDNVDLREELLSYTSILEQGRFKIRDYANACKYVALRNMGKTNYDAYIITFPDRYRRWLETGKSIDEQHQIVSRYNKSKLVVEILKKSLIPTKILNQDLVQKAINVQADLMLNAKSEMVRQKAAETLIRELKIDDDNKLELDITVKKDKSLEALEKTLTEVSQKQLELIKQGQITNKEVAEMNIITVDPEED